MKAIIIAAGRGKRMNQMTVDLPKCMLPFDGKPLIEIQIDILRSLGIQEIIVVKGYKEEKVLFPDIDYYINHDYMNNNILESLFCAEAKIAGDVIIHYCDIIFDKKIVKKLLESKDDISLVADVNWKANYVGRKHHPIEEAENVIFDNNYCVEQIGKILEEQKDNASGEFIGMLKLTNSGAKILKETYHASRAKYQDGPFQRATSIKKAYLTDIIQEIVDNGVKVTCVPVRNGWQEIDTEEDFNNATQLWQNMIK